MATTPFAAQFVTDLSGKTAWRFESALGPVATIRAFCCDDPNDGVNPDGKAPVARISLTPNPGSVGETISYDGSDSYDPDGSVTGYAWTFEGHTPSSGTAASGTLNYATAGTYTIQLIVTDGTGVKSGPAREELIVAQALEETEFYAATSSGVYFASATGGTVTWDDKNSGLSGDELITYDLDIDPATVPLGNRTICRATTGGIFASTDNGSTWVDRTPGTVTNAWGDSVPPSVSDLTFRKILYTEGYLVAIATWIADLSFDNRSVIYYTSDLDIIRSGAGSVTWSELV